MYCVYTICKFCDTGLTTINLGLVIGTAIILVMFGLLRIVSRKVEDERIRRSFTILIVAVVCVGLFGLFLVNRELLLATFFGLIIGSAGIALGIRFSN